MNRVLYGRLSLMMLLEYFVWGSWYVTMGTYISQSLHFDALQTAAAYGTGAIAAMISPFFVGLIADRYFPAQRVLGFMHLLGAALMWLISTVQDFAVFYPLLLAYSLCYMPTIALSNSVAFQQLQHPGRQFPLIRVWGTAGWIVAGLLIGYLGAEAKAIPMQMAAFSSALLGLYAFSLPDTPPKDKGKAVSWRSVIGMEALSLLKARPFLVLFLASVLICIPLMFYYSFTNQFLFESGFPNPAGRMTLGQMSELGFMLLMPLLFDRLGVRRMMLIGMLAWALRYLLFSFGNAGSGAWMLFAGILLHGICYDFFFVTGQIYAENQAPERLRSAVQGMMTFATYGVGMFLGSLVAGPVVERFVQPGSPPHDWYSIWLFPAAISLVVAVWFAVMFREKRGAEG